MDTNCILTIMRFGDHLQRIDGRVWWNLKIGNNIAMPCSTAMGLKFLGFKMYWVLGFKLGLYWIAERVSLSLLSPQLILELCSSPVFTFPSQAHQPLQRAFRFFKDLGLGCIGTGLIYSELMFGPGPAGSSFNALSAQATKEIWSRHGWQRYGS